MVTKKITSRAILIAGVMAVATAAFADDTLRAELKSMSFLADSCWAGKFPDNKRIDTHCFESVYAGAHLRDRHEVLGGAEAYQGETIYSWDEQQSTISYVYWNSYGGVSTGTVQPGSETLEFPDEEYAGPNGARILISSYWENITANSYDSVIAENFADGSTSETRIHFERQQ